MNSYIMVFIALANIIAILLIYYSFGKRMEKQKKMINTMITIGVIYIVTLIIYLFSSIGIAKNVSSDTAKTMITMSFVPVNAIIFAPFLIHSYANMKNKKIEIDQLNRRVILVLIIAIIAIVGEFIYFRNFQKSVEELQEQLKANIESNNVGVQDESNEKLNDINVNSNENGSNNTTNNNEILGNVLDGTNAIYENNIKSSNNVDNSSKNYVINNTVE